MLTPTIKVTKLFFDAPAVLRAVDRARRKVLQEQGKFLRTRARSIIRPARQKSPTEMTDDELRAYTAEAARAKARGLKKPRRPRANSKPGEPPRSHTGLLKMIYYSYDPVTKSVVVGPVKLNAKGKSSGTIPETLEYSGASEVQEVQVYGTWQRARRPARCRAAKLPLRKRRIPIKPRPFMSKAYALERAALPAMWRDSVKGGA
jgi:hypothetical protein